MINNTESAVGGTQVDNYGPKLILLTINIMESVVCGIQVSNYGPKIIGIVVNTMDSDAGGTQMENLRTKRITITAKKLKNKMPGIYFCFGQTMLLPKDLLQLIFLELDHGHDMLNFSELSRRCQQIFHQQIKVTHKPESESKYERKYMKNNHHQKHGIYRWWDGNGYLIYEENYCQDQIHGICREWWRKNGEFMYEDYYLHGRKIEN